MNLKLDPLKKNSWRRNKIVSKSLHLQQMNQAYGDEKKKDFQKSSFKQFFKDNDDEADLIKLKHSLAPKVPIAISPIEKKENESTEYEEGSILGGKYSTITVVNYESSQPSRQNTGIVGGESIVSSLKNSMKKGKDRYVSPVIELPETDNIFRKTFSKRDLFNVSKSVESSPTDAYTGAVNTAYNSKKTLEKTATVQ